MKNSPSLIIIGGFAGAGKTTIATKLAGEFNFPVYSSDEINSALRSSFKKTFHEMSPHAYDILWNLVKKQLGLGVSLVLDVHMARQEIWDTLDELKNDMPNVKILPFILEAPLVIHRTRIDTRGQSDKDHLNLGGDKLEDVLHKYEFIKNLKRKDLVRIDASREVDSVYSTIVSMLQHKGIVS